MARIMTTKKTEVVTEYLDYKNREELNNDNIHYSTETNTVIMKMSPAFQVTFNGRAEDELKTTLWSMISQNGSMLNCTVCGKSKDKTVSKSAKMEMEKHAESLHVDGVTYNCSRCDHVFRSRNSLHKHRYRYHK